MVRNGLKMKFPFKMAYSGIMLVSRRVYNWLTNWWLENMYCFPESGAMKGKYLDRFHDIPGTQMTLLLVRKGLALRG